MLFASLLLGVFLSILLPLGSPFRFRPAGCAVHFVRKPHCGQRIHSKSSDSSISDQAIELHLGQVFPFDDFLQHYRQEARAICGVFALEAADSSILVAAFSDDVYRAVTKISLESSLQGNLIHSIRVQTFPPSQQELMEKYTLELIRQTNPTFSSLDKIFPVLEQDSKSTASYGDVPTSPFATDGSSVGSEKVESVDVVENDIQPFQELEFTFANVDKVLDEVRPYLQADGGNVAVVEVDKEKRSVKLLLEGACGSCPSSTVPALFRCYFMFCIMNLVFTVSCTDDHENGHRAHFERELQPSRRGSCCRSFSCSDSHCREGFTEFGEGATRYKGPRRLRRGCLCIGKYGECVHSISGT